MHSTTTRELDEASSENMERIEQLLADLKSALSNVGLSDIDVAARTGLNRITIQRAKKEGADPKLSTFVAIARAAGMEPSLQKAEMVQGFTDERKVVHRGYSYARITRDEREAVFAKSWEGKNKGGFGNELFMRDLVPNFTQDQASAVATVVQWLGSEVGFEFLTAACNDAGFSLVAKAEPKKRRFGIR